MPPRNPSTRRPLPLPSDTSASTTCSFASASAPVTSVSKGSSAAVSEEHSLVKSAISTVYTRRRPPKGGAIRSPTTRHPFLPAGTASCPPPGKALQEPATVRSAISRENRMGASLLRLHFHDCFVNGCDGSVLLDDTPTFTGEKTAVPNNNSLRGFDVIDSIKAQVEGICPQVVSCADILAVAARDSVVVLGGPTWVVQLGRRDSTTASLDTANNDIPAPILDLGDLTKSFANKGLRATEMIALSGAHTIGQARCINFRTRIYSETNIDTSLATSLKSNCPNTTGDNNISPLDASTPYAFDNLYYKNLQNKKGVLHSDQQLLNGGSADYQATTYSSNMATFFTDFSAAMVKMGTISPLTGSSGQIRKDCRKVN